MSKTTDSKTFTHSPTKTMTTATKSNDVLLMDLMNKAFKSYKQLQSVEEGREALKDDIEKYEDLIQEYELEVECIEEVIEESKQRKMDAYKAISNFCQSHERNLDDFFETWKTE